MPLFGSSMLPYNDFLAQGLTCGCWLPPAGIISPKGKTALHSDTMWYDRENDLCHIGDIGVLWVQFLQLSPPVSHVWYSQCTANLHWVTVVIIEIRITLPSVVWCFRQWIQIQPGSGECECYAIALSRCRFSDIVRNEAFFIIAGYIIWIKEWLTRSWSRCRGDEIVSRYAIGFIDRHMSICGAVFILHLLEKTHPDIV